MREGESPQPIVRLIVLPHRLLIIVKHSLTPCCSWCVLIFTFWFPREMPSMIPTKNCYTKQARARCCVKKDKTRPSAKKEFHSSSWLLLLRSTLSIERAEKWRDLRFHDFDDALKMECRKYFMNSIKLLLLRLLRFPSKIARELGTRENSKNKKSIKLADNR